MRKLPLIGQTLSLTRYLKSRWPLYLICVALMTFTFPASNLLSGFLLGGMMESAIQMDIAPVFSRLPWLLSGVLVLALVQALCRYGQGVAMERASMDLRGSLLRHILRLPIATLRGTNSGNYLSQFTTDAPRAMEALNGLYELLGMLFLSNIAQIAYVFACSPVLAWVTLGVALMSLLFNGGFAPLMRKLNLQKRARMAELSERVSELLGGHTVLRTDNREAFFVDRTTAAVESAFQIDWKTKKISALTSVPAELSRFLIDGVILAAAILLFTDGKLTPDQVMTCWTIGTGVGWSMRSFAHRFTRLQEQLASADRVCALLSESEEQEGAQTAPLQADPAAAFQGMAFAYREDAPLFDQLDLAFKTGQSAALVGGSGGGKSTLALMLLRFYDPIAGRVLLFGRDARDYSLKALRQLTAYVPQTPQLFSGSIADNIRMGRPSATEEEVLQAAELARVDAFAAELPDGLNTLVGERGLQLSGGQRQRVAIARALLKNAPILLLDEATSSLDNQFEQDVQAALQSLPSHCTVITIVHRLRTATGNDVLHVLEKGQLMESGTHVELMQQAGRYAQLWEANEQQAIAIDKFCFPC
ncbi:MAG: ABC transporter ATP-binding protein/permease [Oscillospiraceae bacterium]|nr:ABC transporter ATP-binding protein/permease [Oscillospiraceae bacterium]